MDAHLGSLCQHLQHRRSQMKTRHLLNGVAVIAALAFSAPVWAQAASPSGGNAMGMPGPNPGGGGLTPYSTGAPTSATAAPPPTSSSGTPPMHRHAHHVAHTAPHKKMAPLTGNSAAQLNQQSSPAFRQAARCRHRPLCPTRQRGTPWECPVRTRADQARPRIAAASRTRASTAPCNADPSGTPSSI